MRCRGCSALTTCNYYLLRNNPASQSHGSLEARLCVSRSMELPLKRSIWTTSNLTLNDIIPAYHSGSCLSRGHCGRCNPNIPCRRLSLKVDDLIPAHHAGGCLPSGHFGRRNLSIPCRRLPLKWSSWKFFVWTTQPQHTKQEAASQVITLEDAHHIL